MLTRLMQKIASYGAAETVTGSRHLLTVGSHKILVDCGLFQGDRELRERNWQDFPIPPHEIDAMVVTHAHLDHIGWIPRLVQKGFRGPIYATPATIELARISLLDSAHIQEEDAKHANKHGTRHNPALPLYTVDDVLPAMRLMQPVHYEIDHSLPGGANFRFVPAGHILGSGMAKITLPNGELLLMSGDLGRYNTPIIRDPAVVTHADYLYIESTYGNRVHSHEDVIGKLEMILNEANESKSVVLVPSFSIGRTQELLYYLKKIQEAGKMPKMRVYVDSPMAISVTEMYRTCKEEMDDDMLISLKEGNSELEPDGVCIAGFARFAGAQLAGRADDDYRGERDGERRAHRPPSHAPPIRSFYDRSVYGLSG